MDIALYAAAIFAIPTIAVVIVLRRNAEMKAMVKEMKSDRSHPGGISGFGQVVTTPATAVGQGAVVEPPLVSIKALIGEMQVRAIGLLNSFSIQCVVDGMGRKHCQIQLWVTFYGFLPGSVSPSELVLVGPSTRKALCHLRIPSGHKKTYPVNISYEGDCSWDDILAEAKATMLPNSRLDNLTPWDTWTPHSTLYCDLRLHLPGGEADDPHRASGVKLEFELAQHQYACIRVRIDPWATHESPPASITVL